PRVLPRALTAPVWRLRASINSFLSFDCSSTVIADFSRAGGRSSDGAYFFSEADASARAFINDELEFAQLPSERHSNNTAPAARDAICSSEYEIPMTLVLRAFAGQL